MRMLIAVLSDTHGPLPPGLAERLACADEIWHLGDVGPEEVILELEATGRPVYVVSGNCDFNGAWPHSLLLERAGVRCHLVHIPPKHAPRGAHIVLHGHTHEPRDRTDPLAIRWLNPGAVSGPRNGSGSSFGWLEVADGRVLRWEVERV